MSELWVPDSARQFLNERSGAQNLSEAEKLHRLAAGVMGPRNVVGEDDPAMSDMGSRRRISARARREAAKTAVNGFGTGSGSGTASVSLATGRPMDPMFYWQNSGLPYDYERPDELQKIRNLSRVLYDTHPLIGSAIDIFSFFPLTGMEPVCKDQRLTDFYGDLFFDQLGYDEFAVQVLKFFWIDGEAWPFGSFNELLGVWEDDELILPEDVFVQNSPFLKEPRFLMKLPEVLREILTKKQPKWEYDALVQAYPELVKFVGMTDKALLNVSNVLLKQVWRKGGKSNFNRGVPLLLRAFRHVMQEQKLNAAVDAIADRLYTPLILARLGATAQDLGTPQPWIPTEEDMIAFEDSLDAALAADFRVLVHHFAVQMESVFGRETVPNLDPDFDRIAEAQLQVFGMSKTLLTGADRGETYAADAINLNLVTQHLRGAQKRIQNLWRERAMVVAEAQGHFDYEERGGRKYPIMEEVIEEDEETGEKRIVEQPKLLIPELRIKEMDLRDEEKYQQFVETLRGVGVPISMKTRLTNIPIDLKDEMEVTADEQVELAVEAQRVRKRTYEALRDEGLPIPEDLRADFEAKAMQAQGETATDQQVVPQLGVVEPAETDALVPTGADLEQGTKQEKDQAQPVPDVGPGASNVIPLTPRNRSRPAQSDEQRKTMPKNASKIAESFEVPQVLDHIYNDETGDMVVDEQGEPVLAFREWQPLTDGPTSLGFKGRIASSVDPEKSWGEQEIEGFEHFAEPKGIADNDPEPDADENSKSA